MYEVPTGGVVPTGVAEADSLTATTAVPKRVGSTVLTAVIKCDP